MRRTGWSSVSALGPKRIWTLTFMVTRRSEEVAHPLELVERAARRDDEDLVEAQQLDPLQPHPRFVRRADQRDRSPLGKATRFRLVSEIDQNIGEDGIGAAGFAIQAHPRLEVFPAAVEAGGNPARALPCGIGDPARVAPSPEQHRRAAFATGPGRQDAAIDRLAAPCAAHDLERTHQGAEALLVIGSEEIEIGARRAAADTEAEPAAGQGLDRLHAMGELDRMAQRHLQHWNPELDAAGRDAERAKGDERIKRRPTPAERVGHPNPRKAASFDLPGILDDAMERTAARLPFRPHKGHNAQSHDHPPGENFAVTKSSSLTDR